MSHFSVLVRGSKSLYNACGGDFKQAVSLMMEPFQENNTDSCAIQFLEIVPCDTQLDLIREITTIIQKDSPVAKDKPELVGKRLVDLYDGNIENAMKDMHGLEKDPRTGKFGFWSNPNSKWDWWQIGGRWSDLLPIKQDNAQPKFADIAWKHELDFDHMKIEAENDLRAWWNKYREWKKNNEQESSFYGIHSDLVDMGIREIPALNDVELKAARDKYPEDRSRWPKPIWKTHELTEERLVSEFTDRFKFHTFAACTEENGWMEKAEMGWFGCHTGTPESIKLWQKNFHAVLFGEAKEDDFFAVVDCHV